MDRNKPWYVRHEDDKWLDEIRLVAPDGPFLRCVTRYRYKTSDLSGDEWRTSTMWERRVGEEWEPFDGSYRDIDTACSALFPGLFSSHPDLHNQEIAHIDFVRKGLLQYQSSYEGKSQPLLMVAGHLPWALIHASENMKVAEASNVCMQIGCSEPATVELRLKQRFCRRCGEPEETTDLLGEARRQFCDRHAQRGDCGIEDADRNYEVIVGEAKPEKGDERRSLLWGVVDARK